MPILEVTIVLREGETASEELAPALADAAAAVFNSGPGQTWVLLSTIRTANYGENGGTPGGVFPVFVKVLKAQAPDHEDMPKEVENLTAAFAAIIGRPFENVHLIYEPPAEGRVAFGGRVMGECIARRAPASVTDGGGLVEVGVALYLVEHEGGQVGAGDA